MFTCLIQRRGHLGKIGDTGVCLAQQVIRLVPGHVTVRDAQLCGVQRLKAEPNDDQLSLKRQFREIRKALGENEGQYEGRVSELK